MNLNKIASLKTKTKTDHRKYVLSYLLQQNLASRKLKAKKKKNYSFNGIKNFIEMQNANSILKLCFSNNEVLHLRCSYLSVEGLLLF